MIIVGGENVFAMEVEQVITRLGIATGATCSDLLGIPWSLGQLGRKVCVFCTRGCLASFVVQCRVLRQPSLTSNWR